MSEQILERQATTAPAGLAPSSTPEESGRGNRTFLIVALAIIAGLVIGGAALFLLQPGASDELATGPAPAGSGTAAGGAAGAAPGPAQGTAVEGEAAAGEEAQAAEAAPAAATKPLTSRDPFAPLVPKKPPPPPPAPKPAASEAAPTTSTTGTSATVPSTPTPATGGTISALSISPLGDSVTLKLDGKKYEVDEGEAFAKSYRLYDIFNANCAGFLYGDQNAVVCEGDSVTIG
jgi:hypothetical protein